MTLLTLFSDASFDQHSGAAGWGAWAIKSGWPLGKTMGGEFRRKMPGPTYAELCAIVNALDKLDRDGALDNVTELMVQCDCVPALNTIKNTSGFRSIISNYEDSSIWTRTGDTKHGLIVEAREELRRLCTSRVVYLRHVKAHAPGTDQGNVNELCDRIAREHMSAARARTPERKSWLERNGYKENS